MTGRHLGGGDATTRQTSGTLGGALRPSIEEMAAAASAGLLGAARQPEALFEDAVTRPWQCFLWGLSDEDMLEVAPRINAALAVHMDYEIPEYSLNNVGSVLFLQKQLALMDEFVLEGARLVGCSATVLMVHTHSCDRNKDVQAAFARLRVFMMTMSKAFQEGRGGGGKAGMQPRQASERQGPRMLLPSVSCGGPGLKSACAPS